MDPTLAPRSRRTTRQDRFARAAGAFVLVVTMLTTGLVHVAHAQDGPIDEVGCGSISVSAAQAITDPEDPEASPSPVIGAAGPIGARAVAGITIIPPTAAAAGIASAARSFRTTAGTKPAYLTPYHGGLVFSAREDARGRELWIAGPTQAKRLRDIAPGTVSSSPRDFAQLGDVLYFSAGDATHGRELWRTDGTNAGTRMVKDIRPGARGSNPASLFVLGDRIYFSANDAAHGRELWRTDGTAAGTRLVKDIAIVGSALDEAYPDEPVPWAALDGRLYFGARRTFSELWSTDGTSAGTRRVAGRLVISGSIVSTGSRLFFAASNDDGGCALDGPFLFTSDGTTTGTKELTAAEFPWGPLVAYRTRAWFGNLVERNGEIQSRPRLWRSEGTNATTVQARPAVSMDEDQPLLSVGGRLLMRIRGGLAMSNDRGGQIQVLGDTKDGWRATMDVVAVGGRWFFPAGQRSVRELWRTDGTPAGTRMVLDVNASGNGAVDSLVAADGVVWFVGDDGIRGRQLWRYVPSSR